MTFLRLLTTLALLLGVAAAHPGADALASTSISTEKGTATDMPEGKSSACPTVLGCGADRDAMVELERRIDDNLWYGLALPVDYATDERTLGDVRNIAGQWGDAGLWSGAYLAAESYRYAVAQHRLVSKPNGHDGLGNHKFWTDQRDEALGRIDKLVAQVDLRTYIARSWQTEADPQVDTDRLPPGVDFGGGLIAGQPGMLMFSCAPDDAPPAFAMGVNSDVKGPFAWVNDLGRPARLTLPAGPYVCEASTTRDAYAGTLFGLTTAFDLVGPGDPQLRDVIRDDVLALANFLLANGWNSTRPHGQVTVPFGDVYDNFVTPTMIISPSYRLAISEAALHVAQVAGPQSEAIKWQGVWTEEFATQTPSDVIANEVVDPSPQNGYFGWNLAHLMYATLIRLAPDPVARDLFIRNYGMVDRHTGDDDNAWFETLTYSVTGEVWRRDAAVAHTRDWLDYRRRIDRGGAIDNTSRCGVTITCVPEDEYDVITSTPAGDVVVTVPGSSSRLRSVDPLPVADRVPTDFLWQRSPFTQMDGWSAANHQEPGIDFLLPYWMLRFHTEVEVPALTPMPTWVGPAYSGT